MEGTAINVDEGKSDGEKVELKTGQDDTTAEEVKVTSEVEQLTCQLNNQVICKENGGGVFGILPEELWLKILDEAVDSAEDIQNVLLAFPQLDKLFQKKKASWLFPLVLPHLVSKYLVTEVVIDEVDWTSVRPLKLLNLRQVSKKWKKAVEDTLENHKDRRRPDLVGSNVVSIPENHFNYHRIRSSVLGFSIFQTGEEIDNFLQEMTNFQGNPFPGKSVLLQVIGETLRQAAARLVVLLEKYGEHVIDLEIMHFPKLEDELIGDVQLYRDLLRCLTLVPNLKSLGFTGELFGCVDRERDIPFLKTSTLRLCFQSYQIWKGLNGEQDL